MRTSTVLTLTGATVVTGLLGYAVYFDHKRRNDPAFRSKLRKDKKRTSKELKKQSEQRKRETEETIQKTVTELNVPGALPTSVQEKEEVFMQSVQEGELLIQQGPEYYAVAAAAFFKGLKVYPKPLELLMIYQKAVPEQALNYIYEMVGKDASIGGGASADPLAALAEASRGAPTVGNLEEVDDDSPNKQATPAATATDASTTTNPPSAPVSSHGAESATSSGNNGDASSQEWEKVSQHEEEEKRAEEVARATDEELNKVGQEAINEAKEGQAGN